MNNRASCTSNGAERSDSMTDIQYHVRCCLGSRLGPSKLSEDWEEVKEWKNEMIAKYGAIASFETSYRYLE